MQTANAWHVTHMQQQVASCVKQSVARMMDHKWILQKTELTVFILLAL
jgi:hypothetical protein